MSTAKLFDPIIIVNAIVFVCPIIPIFMFSARTALAILQVLEFLHRLFSSVLVLRFE